MNIIFVPRYGYMACAWGGFAGYGVAMLVSDFVGQKYYPLNYPLGSIAAYVLIAFVAFCVMVWGRDSLPLWVSLALNTVLIIAFVAMIVRRDLPLSSLPVVGKLFKKKEKVTTQI